ncbi:MAG: hypothetical protein AAF921_22295, partial [Cyanobacteria bacterium P01_D01_bin.44]
RWPTANCLVVKVVCLPPAFKGMVRVTLSMETAIAVPAQKVMAIMHIQSGKTKYLIIFFLNKFSISSP